jgi:hypothetical protein
VAALPAATLCCPPTQEQAGQPVIWREVRFQLGSAARQELDLALAQYRRAERTFRQIDLPLRLA